MGDEVQAIKAGILETADVFAVNKADRDGADVDDARPRADDRARQRRRWSPPARRAATSSTAAQKVDVIPEARAADERALDAAHPRSASRRRGEGIAELVEALERHRAWLSGTEAGRARRHLRLAEELRESLRETLIEAATAALGARNRPRRRRRRSQDASTRYTATEQLLAAFRARAADSPTDGSAGHREAAEDVVDDDHVEVLAVGGVELLEREADAMQAALERARSRPSRCP